MGERYLQDKVVVITGASSGFGKGVALKLADAGASVVLAARREELLDELAAECEMRGGRAVAAPTDVSIPEDVDALAFTTLREFGRFDVWINNAGGAALGRFDETPLEAHIKVIETNLLGTLYGSYAAMGHFRQFGGVLINVASVLGKIPSPYFSSYAAAKHGVVGLSGVLRQELAENGIKNIHVCTVLPTSMDTPFFQHAANYTGHQVTPIPPLYDPQKVVDAIVDLVSSPQDEVAVGTAAKISLFAHSVAPDTTEAVMAKHGHREQMEKAPSAPDSEGNLVQPVPAGTEVSGGLRNQ